MECNWSETLMCLCTLLYTGTIPVNGNNVAWRFTVLYIVINLQKSIQLLQIHWAGLNLTRRLTKNDFKRKHKTVRTKMVKFCIPLPQQFCKIRTACLSAFGSFSERSWWSRFPSRACPPAEISWRASANTWRSLSHFPPPFWWNISSTV